MIELIIILGLPLYLLFVLMANTYVDPNKKDKEE